MENLKDQQINSQKETIESLTATVERLERELGKCLEPEVAAGKRKDLTDVRTMTLFENSVYFFDRVFQGITRLVDGLEPDPEDWQHLRNLLLVDPAAKKYSDDDDYRHAVKIISQISERLLAVWLTTEKDRENYRDYAFGAVKYGNGNTFSYRYTQSIPVILLGSPCAGADAGEYQIEKTYRGFLKAREVLLASSHGVGGDDDSKVDYSELKMIIDTVIFSLGYIVKNFMIEE